MRQKTKDAAFGKWRSILGHLGFNELLDGKHHDCPICAGKKKFRFTDYKNGGEWICTCGAGDGFDLLQAVHGWTFQYAAKEVDDVIGNNDLEETFKPEVDYEKRRRNLNKLWSESKRFSFVTEYLVGRGIDDQGTGFTGLTDLRGNDSMYNSDTGKRQPGMCALIRNKGGEPISIHRTFFDPKAKKIMPPTETITGAGVRLGWNDNREKKSLVVGEGIETTIAGMSDLQVLGLAAISAHGMENLIIPEKFESVAILADNDRSFTGQKAAFTLARRLDAEKRKVIIYMPNERGTDILDSGLLDRDILQWTNYE